MRGDEQRKLEQAKAVFATNAVKYHELRALDWARQHRQEVKYAIAKDTISSRALQEKPDLGKDKLTWLQRHDQDCGGLYGVLPLCIGMPVTATDHLDRRRGILKGCPGTVVGWSWHEAAGTAAGSTTHIWNQLPTCVFVRFQTKSEWRVQGLATDNVFPVTLQRQVWTRAESGPCCGWCDGNFRWLPGLPRRRTRRRAKLTQKGRSRTCRSVKAETL